MGLSVIFKALEKQFHLLFKFVELKLSVTFLKIGIVYLLGKSVNIKLLLLVLILQVSDFIHPGLQL